MSEMFQPGDKVRGGRVIVQLADRVIIATADGPLALGVSAAERTMIEEGAERSGQLPGERSPPEDFACLSLAA